MSKPAFVWFEFDNEVVALWQSLSQPTPKKTFAYQSKLRQLILDNVTQNGSWEANLDSLKVLDVFLSAVKSDLAGRNVKEHELVAHPEFMKLLSVLSYHVYQVLHTCVAQKMNEVFIESYTAPVFGWVYAHAMGGQMGGLGEQELSAFYQGLAFLVKAQTAFGVDVAQRFFVLSVIGARVFGSVERTFYDLDDKGLPTCSVEDSLYWAVHDVVERMPTLYDDNAKVLFIAPASASADDVISLDDVVDTTKITASVATFEPTLDKKTTNDNTKDVVAQSMPQTVAPPKSVPIQDTQTQHQPSNQASTQYQQTSTQVSSPNVASPTSSLTTSVRKQKARASHTPKLFQEVYQDLKTIATPSDADERYQKAVMVLDKFDSHIDAEMVKGKMLSDIGFSQKATQARQQAIGLLTAAVKAGNTSAMTRLAVYLFEGRGVPVNTATATNLIKKSAEMGDVRAAKLLSRLYYQGFDADNGGIAMSVEMGEYWLNKSADGGHPEAKKVRAYMRQVEALKMDRQTEIMSDKRYLMWGAVLMAGLLLLAVMIGVFF